MSTTDSQYELTEKYLSGKISFLQYADLLGTDDEGVDYDLEMEDQMAGEPTESSTASETVTTADKGSGSSKVQKTAPAPRKARKSRTLPPAFQGMLGEANLTLARGNAAGAEKICKEVIRQCPSAPEPFRTLALLHEERGDTDSAFQCHMIAAHLGRPGDLHQWLWLADACRERRLYREAADCFRHAAMLSPRDLSLYEKRLECVAHAGDPTRTNSLRILQLALRRLVDRVDVAFSLLRRINDIVLDKQDYGTSVQYSRLVYDKHGDHASWDDLHRYAEVLLHSEHYVDCVKLLCAHCGVTVQLNTSAPSSSPTPAVQSQDSSGSSFPTSSSSTTPSPSTATTVGDASGDRAVSATECSRVEAESAAQVGGASAGTDWQCDVAARAAAAVLVPDRVPIDVRGKLLVALVHLDFIAASETLLKELMLCDVEEFGDLYFDVAEALLAKKRCYMARRVINKLVAVETYCKAGTWLMLARCWRQLDGSSGGAQSVAAYRRVIQLAAHHSDARLELAQLLVDNDRRQEALQVLTCDESGGIAIDSVLLLKKCEILMADDRLSEDLPDELISTVETLLTQHCPVIRCREDAKSMLVLPKSRDNLSTDYRGVDSADIVVENTGVAFVDRPIDVHHHWRLLVAVVTELDRRADYQRCFNLILRARGSRDFMTVAAYHNRLDGMLAIASLRVCDFELGFPVLRRLVLADVSRHQSAVWNLLNLVGSRSCDVRHARFLMRQTHRLPDLAPLCLLNGHNCFTAGTYKYALVEYLTGHKLQPEDPLAPFMVAVTLVQQVSQKFTVDKPSLLAQAVAFLRVYARLRTARSPAAAQEVHYNTARALHQLAMFSEAAHYYQMALQSPAAANCDLSADAAYNLALIYRSSGNEHKAALLVRRHCVI